VRTPKILVVNKVDIANRDEIGEQLVRASAELGDFDAFVPVSARTGAGVDALLEEILGRLPEGPHYYPDGVVSDQPETTLVAELLREQLLAIARDELPHSIAVTAEVLEDDDLDDDEDDDGDAGVEVAEREEILRYRAVVRVERDSQKGIVIGKGGSVIRDAGTKARLELERLFGARVYLETAVRVDKEWQRRAHSLDRLGL
jgi:GTP-binding protein Era